MRMHDFACAGGPASPQRWPANAAGRQRSAERRQQAEMQKIAPGNAVAAGGRKGGAVHGSVIESELARVEQGPKQIPQRFRSNRAIGERAIPTRRDPSGSGGRVRARQIQLFDRSRVRTILADLRRRRSRSLSLMVEPLMRCSACARPPPVPAQLRRTNALADSDPDIERGGRSRRMTSCTAAFPRGILRSHPARR